MPLPNEANSYRYDDLAVTTANTYCNEYMNELIME